MQKKTKPGHLIGSMGHNLFSLSMKRGVIEGIEAIFKSRQPSKVEALVDFDLLPVEETVSFDEPVYIEVMAFEAAELDQAIVPYLCTHVVQLEAGGKITGPIVWRQVQREDAKGDAIVSAGDGSMLLSVLFAVPASVIMVMSVFAAKLWLPGEFTVWGVLFLAYIFVLFFVFEGPKLLARPRPVQGSVQVFAPRKKTWVSLRKPPAAGSD